MGGRVDDWWNYRDRKEIKTEYVRRSYHHRGYAKFESRCQPYQYSNVLRTIKYERESGGQRFRARGRRRGFIMISTVDCKEGRFFNEMESRGARQRLSVIGYDVADALFPAGNPINKSVLISGQRFKVVGVNTRQGSFLGLFSWTQWWLCR